MNHVKPVSWARWSLITVWLLTALVSVLDPDRIGHSLLHQASWLPSASHDGLIELGVVADLGIGVWMWLKPGRPAYLAAACMTCLMTLLATVIAPTLWWHPLGPLSKNLPILALLSILIAQEP